MPEYVNRQMKVYLYDIENQLDKTLVSEAQDVVLSTREFDISTPERGKYHCISRQPDFHVEISLKDNALAQAKCHCPVFKRTGYCKHATASLLMLRDHLKGDRKSTKRHNKEILDDVLRKLNVTELKNFISTYALSHSALRAEILSNYLYLTKKPDYHHLFSDIAPIDKFGKIRINRNNIKTVRSVSANLLKRAQQLLQEKSLSEALGILEAILTHLHRLHGKVLQFQDQLMIELKHAYRLFEILCHSTMAPRLQLRTINLSIEICSRDSYIFPAGMRPLLSMTEQFILEEKVRKEAFAIAQQKIKSEAPQLVQWASLVYHWMNIWQMKPGRKDILYSLEKLLPDIIREFHQHGDHLDVLYALGHADKKKYSSPAVYSILQSGLRSAKSIGHKEKVISLAYELVLHYIDEEAWNILYEADEQQAVHALTIIEEIYAPLSDPKADQLLLKAWHLTGNGMSMISRLKMIGDVDLLKGYDRFLKEKFRTELEDLYVGHIQKIRDAYGGVAGRQKLNNIFSHLKEIDLFTSVTEKIKTMEKSPLSKIATQQIKGFVFDLDGVIVDTAVHHFQAWKEILREVGAEITEEDDHHTRGAGRMESLQYLLDKYSIELSEPEKIKWAAKKNDVYLQSIESITPDDLLPGVLRFLEESRNMGLLIALGSASKNAGTVLKKLNVADRFHAIVDGNDTKASKPDPEIFIKACAAIGLEPASVVVFEDAPKGIQAAVSAGCLTVGIGEPRNLPQAQIVIPGLHAFSPRQIIEQLT